MSRADKEDIALSIIIPAYNEAERLSETLPQIIAWADAQPNLEVIVVNDGSVDSTESVVKEAARQHPYIQLINLPQNSGKGAAVQAGMLAARGRRRLFCDADLSTPLTELEKLNAALDQGFDVAIGSRRLPSSVLAHRQPWRRELIGRVYSGMLRMATGEKLMDTQCGFKLFTAEAAQVCFTDLQTQRFGFDAEVLARARGNGLTIAEVGVVWRDDPRSTVQPWRDGRRMLVDLLRLRQRMNSSPNGGSDSVKASPSETS